MLLIIGYQNMQTFINHFEVQNALSLMLSLIGYHNEQTYFHQFFWWPKRIVIDNGLPQLTFMNHFDDQCAILVVNEVIDWLPLKFLMVKEREKIIDVNLRMNCDAL